MVRNQAKSSDTIGGLASAAGVGVETVRYYQRRGLLPEPPRPPSEVRRYGEADVKRLRFIRSAQAAGFTLNEIRELIDLDASDDRARARELAQARVAAIDEKIAELREARDALAGLASACAKKRGGRARSFALSTGRNGIGARVSFIDESVPQCPPADVSSC